MKTKKAMLLFLCAIVMGLSVMTVSAEERTQDNSQGDAPIDGLIAPAPENTDNGAEPNLIAPAPDGNIATTSTSSGENNLLGNAGILILGMTCIIAVVTILIVVIYKKK